MTTSPPLNDLSDAELLSRYTRNRSEEAFAILVARYVDLIYSTVLRRVRDPHLAEDVTQAVFLILARRAQSIGSETILAGWLYKSARYAAANALRLERRRSIHEHAAAALPRKEPRMDANWEQIEPALEDAMDSLRSSDRQLILLRYFQNRSLNDMSAALGISDNTAAKRLSRAVERLRAALTDRGVTAGGSGLVALLAENAVHAVPTMPARAPNATVTQIARNVMRLMSFYKAATVAIIFLTAVALVVSAVAIARRQSSAQIPPIALEATAAATSPLDKVLPAVSLNNVAMWDTMDFLHDVYGHPIKVDWHGLLPLGVTLMSNVSLNEKNIAVGKLIELIFAKFPATAGRLKIQADADGAISITATPAPTSQP